MNVVSTDNTLTVCDVCVKKLKSGEIETLHPLVYDHTGGGHCPHCGRRFEEMIYARKE